jgi:hypothetical protein
VFHIPKLIAQGTLEGLIHGIRRRKSRAVRFGRTKLGGGTKLLDVSLLLQQSQHLHKIRTRTGYVNTFLWAKLAKSMLSIDL